MLLIRLNADTAEQAARAQGLREYAVSRGGSLVVLDAPVGFRSQLDRPDEANGARLVMRAIKERFDPHGVLSSSGLGLWAPGSDP